MTPSFATSLDALGGWRAALGERAEALARFLGEHDLAHGEAAEQIAALRERLGNEKLVVAFVAEFSRGKSELITRSSSPTPADASCPQLQAARRCARSSSAGAATSRRRCCCCRSRHGSRAFLSARCAPSRVPGAASRSTSATPT